MPARLVPLVSGLIRPIPLERPVVLIGRHQECDAQVAHSRISRRHCCVAQIAGGLVIRDLGSHNGVRINGERIEEAALEDGDEIAIGPILFRLDWPRSSHEGSEPVAPKAETPEIDSGDLVPLDDD
ncbi:FHA domain-containing protein [Tautonia marina]|uniref:FHA domain-containing protein n=1 Tax=Tautonia marina TaxID=2653855 RepID=UPI001260B434|nr:FHA domain-containing protein [Tautonia marina]